MKHYRSVPVAPVIPYLELRRGQVMTPKDSDFTGLPAVFERLTGMDRNNWHRAVKDGSFTLGMADRLACAMKLHPSLIWGEAWWQATEMEVA